MIVIKYISKYYELIKKVNNNLDIFVCKIDMELTSCALLQFITFINSLRTFLSDRMSLRSNAVKH